MDPVENECEQLAAAGRERRRLWLALGVLAAAIAVMASVPIALEMRAGISIAWIGNLVLVVWIVAAAFLFVWASTLLVGLQMRLRERRREWLEREPQHPKNPQN